MASWQLRLLHFIGERNEIHKSGLFGQVYIVSEWESILEIRFPNTHFLLFHHRQTISLCWHAHATPWKPPSPMSKLPQWLAPCPPHWDHQVLYPSSCSLGISILPFLSHVSWTPQIHSYMRTFPLFFSKLTDLFSRSSHV